MPVKESSATALVRITGLAIIRFNPGDHSGQIGIVRDLNHHLKIRIQRPVYQDGTGRDVVVYRDIASYEQLPKENVRVEIKAHGSPVAGYEIYQNGEFDRLNSTDLHDFRWLVDIENLHEGGILNPSSQQQSYPLSGVYIREGRFYTQKVDRNRFFAKVEKDANGIEGQREEFGNVGETLGVAIEGDQVSFTIRIGDQETTHLLPRLEGLPFIIECSNMNPDAGAVFSDMPDYYKYIASSSGNQFDLKPVEEETAAGTVRGGAVNQEDFCHPIVFPEGSIDEL
jgi:hypothetical protein